MFDVVGEDCVVAAMMAYETVTVCPGWIDPPSLSSYPDKGSEKITKVEGEG